MSVSTSKNNLSVIIGKDASRTGSVQYTDPNAAAYLADGEVLVVNETGAILTNTATVGNAPRFRIVQRSGNRLIYSPVISGLNVKSYRGTAGVSASEQISYIGYDGVTAGTEIDVTGTDDFILNLSFNFDESMWSEQLNNYPFMVKFVTSITEATVASSLAKQINAQMTNGWSFSIAGEGPLVKATVLCNDAGSAVGAAADTVVGYAGSNKVTITDVGSNNTCFAIAVGDYFRAGTALTDPVYKVVASTATSTAGGVLTLDMPLQANVSLAGNAAEFITAANAATAACGVKLVGQALKSQFHPQGEFKYLQVNFKTSLKQGFGSTTSSTTAATRPVSSGIQIAELEQYAEGFRGNLNRTVVPLTSLKQDADTSVANYDVISISWFDTSDTSPIDGTKPSQQELIIAFVNGAATQVTDATNGVLTVLNAYMPTTPAALPAVSL